MSLGIRKSEFFIADAELQFRWYERHANWNVACRYFAALDATLMRLADRPDLGRIRRFKNEELKDLRSQAVERPFQRHLIFYRYSATTLDAVRVMHGARNLPQRLIEPPMTSR